MTKMLFTAFVVLLFLQGYAQNEKKDKKTDSTIYSFSVDSLNGKSKIDMSRLAGKKMVIVAYATLDSNFSQVIELKKLVQRNNNIVVVVFPTNDFNTEPATEKEIGLFLARYGLPFIVGSKIHVTGKQIHPLFQWLTKKSLNGVAESQIKAAFQKYLIDEDGKLEQVLLARQRPYSDKNVRGAIEKIKKG